MSDLQHSMCVLHQTYTIVVSVEAIVIIALLKVSERKCGFLSFSKKKQQKTPNQTEKQPTKQNKKLEFFL